jgi:PEGA domain
MRRSRVLFCAFLIATVPSGVVRAAPEDASLVQAREDFLRGADFIRRLQYADALAAFERSARGHPHAATTYNIGVCLRAMGRYTLARKRLAQALTEDAAAGGAELPDSLKAEARGFLEQIDALLARVDVTLTPADAALTIDGQPPEVLEVAAGASASAAPTLVAGTRPPGPGEIPPGPAFSLVLDPGAHVLTMTRKGFADSVVNKIFPPGVTLPLKLELDLLPATLHVASNSPLAVVTVNDVDVGLTPVDVLRPAGQFRVAVKKSGFIAYETDVLAHAGERVDLMANLKPYKAPLTQKWWFWSAAAVLVGGVVVVTYAATRPSPTRPPLEGGGLGWTLLAQ